VLLRSPRRKKPTGFLLWWYPTDIPEGKRNWLMISKMETLYNKEV
jgi:hypothetical protein